MSQNNIAHNFTHKFKYRNLRIFVFYYNLKSMYLKFMLLKKRIVKKIYITRLKNSIFKHLQHLI